MSRGSKNLIKDENATLQCMCCGEHNPIDDYYHSNSVFFGASKKIPYCNKCIEKLFRKYETSYMSEGYPDPKKKAMERLCMAFDIYFDSDVYEAALERKGTATENTPITSLYLKRVRMNQTSRKTYDNTIKKKTDAAMLELGKDMMMLGSDNDSERAKTIFDAERFFGKGFSDEDYLFLSEQYQDWTTRHECETKSQEEVFKQICFTQLEILNAQRTKQDTKDLVATFQKLLDTAKLQPKQNHSETNSNTQTFGTLIDKWENTRPIPEIDEDLRDVDKIAVYIDTFFRGHLAKMMGIKNGFSTLYERFMKKYTVTRPEYDDESDSEALFDAIFGGELDE